MKQVYLDNAASSWPIPEAVNEAIVSFNRACGANPGRSGHVRSIDAGRIMYEAREKIAAFFNAPDPLGVVFTKNATEALNIATIGLLHPGDHVVVTGFEHNALMRPLRFLEKSGVSITVLPASAEGATDPDAVRNALRRETKAVYCNHVSNVTGTIMPVREIGSIARERELIFCVDAAQSAGILPVDMSEMNIGLLAFTGHKALCGPQGTGGLVIAPGLEKRMRPVVFGGTGSRSELEEQPDFLPDMFESGTPNVPGIAGLSAGIDYVTAKGLDAIRRHELALTARLMEGVRAIPGVVMHGPADPSKKSSIVSITCSGSSPSEISYILDDEYGVQTRPGLHCAPAAHKSIGTFPEGTVRMSLSFFTTLADVEYTIDALSRIMKKA